MLAPKRRDKSKKKKGKGDKKMSFKELKRQAKEKEDEKRRARLRTEQKQRGFDSQLTAKLGIQFGFEVGGGDEDDAIQKVESSKTELVLVNTGDPESKDNDRLISTQWTRTIMTLDGSGSMTWQKKEENEQLGANGPIIADKLVKQLISIERLDGVGMFGGKFAEEELKRHKGKKYFGVEDAMNTDFSDPKWYNTLTHPYWIYHIISEFVKDHPDEPFNWIFEGDGGFDDEFSTVVKKLMDDQLLVNLKSILMIFPDDTTLALKQKITESVGDILKENNASLIDFVSVDPLASDKNKRGHNGKTPDEHVRDVMDKIETHFPLTGTVGSQWQSVVYGKDEREKDLIAFFPTNFKPLQLINSIKDVDNKETKGLIVKALADRLLSVAKYSPDAFTNGQNTVSVYAKLHRVLSSFKDVEFDVVVDGAEGIANIQEYYLDEMSKLAKTKPAVKEMFDTARSTDFDKKLDDEDIERLLLYYTRSMLVVYDDAVGGVGGITGRGDLLDNSIINPFAMSRNAVWDSVFHISDARHMTVSNYKNIESAIEFVSIRHKGLLPRQFMLFDNYSPGDKFMKPTRLEVDWPNAVSMLIPVTENEFDAITPDEAKGKFTYKQLCDLFMKYLFYAPWIPTNKASAAMQIKKKSMRLQLAMHIMMNTGILSKVLAKSKTVAMSGNPLKRIQSFCSALLTDEYPFIERTLLGLNYEDYKTFDVKDIRDDSVILEAISDSFGESKDWNFKSIEAMMRFTSSVFNNNTLDEDQLIPVTPRVMTVLKKRMDDIVFVRKLVKQIDSDFVMYTQKNVLDIKNPTLQFGDIILIRDRRPITDKDDEKAEHHWVDEYETFPSVGIVVGEPYEKEVDFVYLDVHVTEETRAGQNGSDKRYDPAFELDDNGVLTLNRQATRLFNAHRAERKELRSNLGYEIDSRTISPSKCELLIRTTTETTAPRTIDPRFNGIVFEDPNSIMNTLFEMKTSHITQLNLRVHHRNDNEESLDVKTLSGNASTRISKIEWDIANLQSMRDTLSLKDTPENKQRIAALTRKIHDKTAEMNSLLTFITETEEGVDIDELQLDDDDDVSELTDRQLESLWLDRKAPTKADIAKERLKNERIILDLVSDFLITNNYTEVKKVPIKKEYMDQVLKWYPEYMDLQEEALKYIPSNWVFTDEFKEAVLGFSIGHKDTTDEEKAFIGENDKYPPIRYSIDSGIRRHWYVFSDGDIEKILNRVHRIIEYAQDEKTNPYYPELPTSKAFKKLFKPSKFKDLIGRTLIPLDDLDPVVAGLPTGERVVYSFDPIVETNCSGGPDDDKKGDGTELPNDIPDDTVPIGFQLENNTKELTRESIRHEMERLKSLSGYLLFSSRKSGVLMNKQHKKLKVLIKQTITFLKVNKALYKEGDEDAEKKMGGAFIHKFTRLQGQIFVACLASWLGLIDNKGCMTLFDRTNGTDHEEFKETPISPCTYSLTPHIGCWGFILRVNDASYKIQISACKKHKYHARLTQYIIQDREDRNVKYDPQQTVKVVTEFRSDPMDDPNWDTNDYDWKSGMMTIKQKIEQEIFGDADPSEHDVEFMNPVPFKYVGGFKQEDEKKPNRTRKSTQYLYPGGYYDRTRTGMTTQKERVPSMKWDTFFETHFQELVHPVFEKETLDVTTHALVQFAKRVYSMIPDANEVLRRALSVMKTRVEDHGSVIQTNPIPKAMVLGNIIDQAVQARLFIEDKLIDTNVIDIVKCLLGPRETMGRGQPKTKQQTSRMNRCNRRRVVPNYIKSLGMDEDEIALLTLGGDDDDDGDDIQDQKEQTHANPFNSSSSSSSSSDENVAAGKVSFSLPFQGTIEEDEQKTQFYVDPLKDEQMTEYINLLNVGDLFETPQETTVMLFSIEDGSVDSHRHLTLEFADENLDSVDIGDKNDLFAFLRLKRVAWKSNSKWISSTIDEKIKKCMRSKISIQRLDYALPIGATVQVVDESSDEKEMLQGIVVSRAINPAHNIGKSDVVFMYSIVATEGDGRSGHIRSDRSYSDFCAGNCGHLEIVSVLSDVKSLTVIHEELEPDELLRLCGYLDNKTAQETDYALLEMTEKFRQVYQPLNQLFAVGDLVEHKGEFKLITEMKRDGPPNAQNLGITYELSSVRWEGSWHVIGEWESPYSPKDNSDDKLTLASYDTRTHFASSIISMYDVEHMTPLIYRQDASLLVGSSPERYIRPGESISLQDGSLGVVVQTIIGLVNGELVVRHSYLWRDDENADELFITTRSFFRGEIQLAGMGYEWSRQMLEDGVRHGHYDQDRFDLRGLLESLEQVGEDGFTEQEDEFVEYGNEAAYETDEDVAIVVYADKKTDPESETKHSTVDGQIKTETNDDDDAKVVDLALEDTTEGVIRLSNIRDGDLKGPDYLYIGDEFNAKDGHRYRVHTMTTEHVMRDPTTYILGLVKVEDSKDSELNQRHFFVPMMDAMGMVDGKVDKDEFFVSRNDFTHNDNWTYVGQLIRVRPPETENSMSGFDGPPLEGIITKVTILKARDMSEDLVSGGQTKWHDGIEERFQFMPIAYRKKDSMEGMFVASGLGRAGKSHTDQMTKSLRTGKELMEQMQMLDKMAIVVNQVCPFLVDTVVIPSVLLEKKHPILFGEIQHLTGLQTNDTEGKSVDAMDKKEFQTKIKEARLAMEPYLESVKMGMIVEYTVHMESSGPPDLFIGFVVGIECMHPIATPENIVVTMNPVEEGADYSEDSKKVALSNLQLNTATYEDIKENNEPTTEMILNRMLDLPVGTVVEFDRDGPFRTFIVTHNIKMIDEVPTHYIYYWIGGDTDGIKFDRVDFKVIEGATPWDIIDAEWNDRFTYPYQSPLMGFRRLSHNIETYAYSELKYVENRSDVFGSKSLVYCPLRGKSIDIPTKHEAEGISVGSMWVIGDSVLYMVTSIQIIAKGDARITLVELIKEQTLFDTTHGEVIVFDSIHTLELQGLLVGPNDIPRTASSLGSILPIDWIDHTDVLVRKDLTFANRRMLHPLYSVIAFPDRLNGTDTKVDGVIFSITIGPSELGRKLQEWRSNKKEYKDDSRDAMDIDFRVGFYHVITNESPETNSMMKEIHGSTFSERHKYIAYVPFLLGITKSEKSAADIIRTVDDYCIASPLISETDESVYALSLDNNHIIRGVVDNAIEEEYKKRQDDDKQDEKERPISLGHFLIGSKFAFEEGGEEVVIIGFKIKDFSDGQIALEYEIVDSDGNVSWTSLGKMIHIVRDVDVDILDGVELKEFLESINMQSTWNNLASILIAPSDHRELSRMVESLASRIGTVIVFDNEDGEETPGVVRSFYIGGSEETETGVFMNVITADGTVPIQHVDIDAMIEFDDTKGPFPILSEFGHSEQDSPLPTASGQDKTMFEQIMSRSFTERLVELDGYPDPDTTQPLFEIRGATQFIKYLLETKRNQFKL